MTYEELMAIISAGKTVPDSVDASAIIAAHFDGGSADALKNKNRELLQKLADAKNKASTLPDDFDPDRWEKLLKAEREAEEKKLADSQQWESLKEQIQKQHSDELKKQTEMTEKLKQSLEMALVESKLKSAVAKESGNLDLLMPHLMPKMKMVESGGAFDVVVVDQSGASVLSKEKPGETMSELELVRSLKANEVFAPAFTASNRGGGASGGGGAGGGKNPFSKDSFNLTEQAKMLNTNPALAKQMKAAAEG